MPFDAESAVLVAPDAPAAESTGKFQPDSAQPVGEDHKAVEENFKAQWSNAKSWVDGLAIMGKYFSHPFTRYEQSVEQSFARPAVLGEIPKIETTKDTNIVGQATAPLANAAIGLVEGLQSAGGASLTVNPLARAYVTPYFAAKTWEEGKKAFHDFASALKGGEVSTGTLATGVVNTSMNLLATFGIGKGTIKEVPEMVKGVIKHGEVEAQPEPPILKPAFDSESAKPVAPAEEAKPVAEAESAPKFDAETAKPVEVKAPDIEEPKFDAPPPVEAPPVIEETPGEEPAVGAARPLSESDRAKMRAEETGNLSDKSAPTFTLRDLLVGNRDALAEAGLKRPIRLKTPSMVGPYAGEHRMLMSQKGAFGFFSKDGVAGDQLVAKLQELGFYVEHVNDAYELVARAMRGEEVRPEGGKAAEVATFDEASAEPIGNVENPSGPTGTKNAIIDQDRAAIGLPKAMEQAAREMPVVWGEAMSILDRNPDAGKELVTDLQEQTRAVTDTERAILLHRKIELEHRLDQSAREVNEAQPADLPKARAQFDKVSDDLLDLYSAAQRAGTESGRSLNAIKMMANRDYTLAQMVSHRRAVNDGKPLTEAQLKTEQEWKAKIDAVQKEFDDYRAKKEAGSRSREPRRAKPPGRLSEALSRQAEAARARIRERSGRVSSGLDPLDIADHAIVATEYIAKGIQKGAEFAEAMVKEFGERIRPHLDAIWEKAQSIMEDDAHISYIEERRKALEASIKTLEKKIEEKDLSPQAQQANRPDIQELEVLRQKKDGLAAELTRMRDVAAKVDELEKAIAEKDRKIKTGDLSANGVELNRPSIEEVEVLKQKRDAMNKKLADARRDANRPTEADRIAREVAKLDEQITEKKNQLAKGDLEPKATRANRPDVEPIEKLKQEREQLNKELAKARAEANKPTEAEVVKRKVEAIEKQIAEKEAKLEKGDVSVKPKSQGTVPAELAEAKKRLAEVNKEMADARKEIATLARGPKKTAQERRLAAFKTRTLNTIKETNEKIATKDFAPRAKPEPLQMDAEAMRLKAERDRVVQAYEDSLNEDRLAHRTPLEKVMEGFINFRRVALISGIKTAGKVGAAGQGRILMTAADTAAGSILGRLPVLRQIAEAAPREGLLTGKTIENAAKGYVEGWVMAMDQSWKVLKTGKTDVEISAGSRAYRQTLLNYFANTHALLKLPAFAQEYKISLRERVAYELKKGTDMRDPVEQIRVNNEAVADGLRAKFSHENFVSKRLNMVLESLHRSTSHPTTAKVVEGVLRFLFPIVHIPTNFFAESATYSNLGLGLPRATVKTFEALRRGVEKLTPAEADSIMRHWKKGSLGAGLMLLGFYLRDNVGGYYQPGKQKKDAPEFGGMVIAGHHIPRWLIHIPILEPIHFGATIGHVMDHITKKTGKKGDLADGVVAGITGLLDEIPYVSNARNAVEALEPVGIGKYARGELVKSAVVPRLMAEIAEYGDRDAKGNPVKRKVDGALEHIQSGIPVLRERLPVRK